MAIKSLASQRMSDFRRVLKHAGLDGYLTAAHLEQRYLSGIDLYDGEAVFLITPAKGYCLTKRLIASKMTPSAKFLKTEIVPYGGMLEGALAKIKTLGLKRVAFDPALIDLERGQALLKAGLCKASGLIGEMRMAKYADEVAKLRKACQIAWHSFEEVKPQIKTGMTEEDVRVLMALAMHKRGADSIPFNIVCFGENTADAHHTPSKTRKLKAEEAVLMDFGCYYEGYTSDMTRSWWHGKKEPAEYTKIWKIVDKARKAGIKTVGIGVPCKKVDATARGIISAAGYGQYYTHGTGHGVGIEIHEDPYNSQQSSAILSEGNIVTVEPGIYLPGKFGVRLEDTVAVAKSGAKILTKK